MTSRFYLAIASLVLCLLWSGFASAETVTITFEDLPPTLVFDANQSIRGPFPDNQSAEFGGTRGEVTVDGLTLGNLNFPGAPGSDFEDFFSGAGFSQRSLTTVPETDRFFDSNDLIAAGGVGEGNSDTWAVFFGSGTLTTDVGSTIDSLFFNNTLVTRDIVSDDTLDSDGQFDFGAFRGLGANQEFGVRFVDQSATGSGGSISQQLASYDLATDTVTTVEDFTFLDLTELNSNQIGIEFFSSDIGPFGINTPTYIAIDSVAVTSLSATGVPEPSSLVMFGCIGIFAACRRRPRNRR